MSVETDLKGIGLTKGESKTYLALLELGLSTKSAIVRKSKISPSIIYEILDRLISKGLASSIIVDKVKHFQAADPTVLLEFLNQEKDRIECKKELVKSLIPLLKQNEKTQNIFNATVYEGLDGLRSMLQKVIEEEFKANKTREWLATGVTSHKNESFNNFWINWHGKIRPKYRVKAKFIFSEKATKYYHALKKLPLNKIRYIPLSTPVCITAVGKTLLVMKYAHPSYFLLIRNEDVSNTFKEFFRVMWTAAKG
ncbi:hypothetical protein EPN87_04100 [archaeon]|nr:MAG: hypothetical protein EPN87_04100 [archaeon]